MRILLLIYDNGSYLHHFPMGTAYIASALRDAGHKVEIYQQDINHWPEAHLTNYLDENRFDAVGFGFVGNYYTYQKALKIADAVNASKHRPRFVLGGHGPSAEPEFFLEKLGADSVVVGEGENGVLKAVQENGIFKSTLEDIDNLPWPAYDLFPIEYYRLKQAQPHSDPTDFQMPVSSARGCIYKCNFCYRMDEGYRVRSVQNIVDEVRFLQNYYGITYVDFVDDLTMSSVDRAAELSYALLPLNIKWSCNGRLNFAKPEILKLMKRSGCVFINYGIEAMDDEVLKTMNKHLKVTQIHEGIKHTLDTGISPGFNIIFGHIGDNRETLQKAIEFLIRYDDGAQRRTIGPVQPYPGSDLYKYAIKNGHLKDCEDFYAKHINSDLPTVNFTELSDDEFLGCLAEANETLLRNYYQKQLDSILEQSKDLYNKKVVNFRGFR